MIPRRDEKSSSPRFTRSRESCSCTPDADASSVGRTSTYQAGETGVVYVTERDCGGERSVGGSPWWGGRSRGSRPRRRRLSLRRGGIAVVAAVRYDPAAVSQYALFFVPHVLSVGLGVSRDYLLFFSSVLRSRWISSRESWSTS